MSRVFTIVVILALMAVVALVPRIGKDEPGPDLGEGYAYREDTLARFRRLLEGDGWTLADPPRSPQGMLEAVHGKTGLTFVLIPAGSFKMGSPEDEEGRMANEGPVHRVSVPAFLLCRTECTQRAWDRIGGEDWRSHQGPDLPIEFVSGKAVGKWCRGVGVRLPSEAEWEYACRAGTRTTWYFGEDRNLLSDHAWHEENSGSRSHAAGKGRSNPWGLHEVLGNVWELCADRWQDTYERAPTDGSAFGADRTWRRVARGGGWNCPWWACRSSSREFCYAPIAAGLLGFRPAADLPE